MASLTLTDNIHEHDGDVEVAVGQILHRQCGFLGRHHVLQYVTREHLAGEEGGVVPWQMRGAEFRISGLICQVRLNKSSSPVPASPAESRS